MLVVSEGDVLPDNVLLKILFLLFFEQVTHKELLQLLIGKVNAQLLKAGKKEN